MNITISYEKDIKKNFDMKSTKETLTFLTILIIPLVLEYNLHSWAWEGGIGEQYYEKKGNSLFRTSVIQMPSRRQLPHGP